MRDTILILENNNTARRSLVEIFQEKYKVLEVSNERAGLDLLRANLSSVAVVLVNISIPAGDDFRVLQHLEKKDRKSTRLNSSHWS